MVYPIFKREMSNYVRVVGLGLVLMLLLLGAFSRAAIEIDDGRALDALFGNNGGPNTIPQAVGVRADRDAETQMVQGARQTGTVKWFSVRMGYGYIKPDAGGRDLFVHHSALRVAGLRTLSAGQRVDYIVDQSAAGPTARDVQLLSAVNDDQDAQPGTNGGARQTGTVRWFNVRKGHGTIKPDAGGRDLFVHHSALHGAGFRTLSAGQRVDYIVGRSAAGPAARDVQLLGAVNDDQDTQPGTNGGARNGGTIFGRPRTAPSR